MPIRPTLKELDHNIPVVASPNAAKVVQELGYRQVTALDHGEALTWDDSVKIQAFPGSPIGPPAGGKCICTQLT